jgi:error-prone DNA polymerase
MTLPAHLPAYAELHCRSNFSFLTGASHPGELVRRARELGYSALAITDECSVAGVVRAHEEAKAQGLHLIVGAEMRLTQVGNGTPGMRLVALAESLRGYRNLSRWITIARLRATKGDYLAHPSDLEGRIEGKGAEIMRLAGLPGCRVLLVPNVNDSAKTLQAQAKWLRSWFDGRAGIAMELLNQSHDALLRERVKRVAAEVGLPVIAAGDVLMHVRSRKPLQDTLTAIRLRRTLAECGEAIQPNAEQHLRYRGQLARLYEPQWLDNTVRWAEACDFSLQELKYDYPQELVPPGHTPSSWLRKLAYEGLERRYAKIGKPPPEDVKAGVEKELGLIARKGFERFFLTVAEIVSWARSKDILCQGRAG